MIRLLGLLLALCQPDCRIALPAGYTLTLVPRQAGAAACLRTPDDQPLLCDDEVAPRLRQLFGGQAWRLPAHIAHIAHVGSDTRRRPPGMT